MVTILKNWSSEDIIRGRCYADLGECGEFEADTREPLEVISPWWIATKGARTYYKDDEILEEKIELYIELDKALSEEEIEELSAGEIFSRGWRNYSF